MSACLSWQEAYQAGAAVCGGKGYNLARLARYGFRVPRGFVLPAGSPVPAIVRGDGKDGVWVLYTLARELVALDAKGTPRGPATPVPPAAGALFRLAVTPAGPVAVGDQGLWRP